MPIDPAGISPGLTHASEKAATINMRCKNPDCDSIVAIELTISGQGLRTYQCCKCKMTRGIAVGGGFSV